MGLNISVHKLLFIVACIVQKVLTLHTCSSSIEISSRISNEQFSRNFIIRNLMKQNSVYQLHIAADVLSFFVLVRILLFKQATEATV